MPQLLIAVAKESHAFSHGLTVCYQSLLHKTLLQVVFQRVVWGMLSGHGLQFRCS